MVVLTFKDVGQGDSILLSWQENEKKKIGIIDCNKYKGRNPVLEEISNLEEEFEIEFIVISHGHKDHYSGILELLNYCKTNKLIINEFISTLHNSQFQFYDITLSRNEVKSISHLLTIVDQFYENGIILDLFPAYNKIICYTMENYKFECLYPRQRDYNILGRKLDKYIKGNIKTKPDLNYIATIFKLTNDENYILLTSDCINDSLDYVSRKDEDVKTKTLYLGQAPHHGSVKNHNEQFWKNRKKRENCPIVFSVGTSRHNLPDPEVVKGFKEMDYQIYATNYVNGIKSYIENKETQKDYSCLLDSFSELYDESIEKGNDRLRGDKIFELP